MLAYALIWKKNGLEYLEEFFPNYESMKEIKVSINK